ETAEHKPCRLLGNSDFLGQLHRTDTLAGGDKQVHCIEPFVQRYVTALENGSSADCEVKLALIAAVKASLAGRDAILTGAGWASYAFGPEARFQVDSCCLLIGEHLEKLKCADGRTAHSRGLSGGLRTARGYQPHAPLAVDAARWRLADYLSHVKGCDAAV